jgi:hypothetical protein
MVRMIVLLAVGSSLLASRSRAGHGDSAALCRALADGVRQRDHALIVSLVDPAAGHGLRAAAAAALLVSQRMASLQAKVANHAGPQVARLLQRAAPLIDVLAVDLERLATDGVLWRLSAGRARRLRVWREARQTRGEALELIERHGCWYLDPRAGYEGDETKLAQALATIAKAVEVLCEAVEQQLVHDPTALASVIAAAAEKCRVSCDAASAVLR